MDAAVKFYYWLVVLRVSIDTLIGQERQGERDRKSEKRGRKSAPLCFRASSCVNVCLQIWQKLVLLNISAD